MPDLFQPNLLCAGSEVHLKIKGLQHTRMNKVFLLFILFQIGSGSCLGDSGGPLVFNDKSSSPSRFVQVGIVQGGAGQCGNERFPGVYARLDDYDVLSFIYKTAFGENIDSSPRSLGK